MGAAQLRHAPILAFGSGLNVSVTLHLQMAEFSNATWHNVVFKNLEEVIFVTDFAAFKRVVADVEIHVLRF